MIALFNFIVITQVQVQPMKRSLDPSRSVGDVGRYWSNLQTAGEQTDVGRVGGIIGNGRCSLEWALPVDMCSRKRPSASLFQAVTQLIKKLWTEQRWESTSVEERRLSFSQPILWDVDPQEPLTWGGDSLPSTLIGCSRR